MLRIYPMDESKQKNRLPSKLIKRKPEHLDYQKKKKNLRNKQVCTGSQQKCEVIKMQL